MRSSRGAEGQGREAGSTIDQLAQRAGTTVRNVRVFQARGIVPPPQVTRRTGYYGLEHLQRVRSALRLQQRGYSIAAIADLIAAWDRGEELADLLGFPRQRRRRVHGSADDWAPTFDELAGTLRSRLALVPGFVVQPA